MTKTLSGALAATVAAAFFALAPLPASAATVTESYSGNFGANAVSGSITLDVVGGQAQSGTGTFSGFGLSNVSMVLITPLTPGNETSPGPVGFRANDGTDFGGLNTVIPIDSIGLLWDINTPTALWGAFPLLNLASGPNNSTFTGKVGDIEYYDKIGTINIAPTPLPGALPLFASAFGGGMLLLRGRKKKAGAQPVKSGLVSA